MQHKQFGLCCCRGFKENGPLIEDALLKRMCVCVAVFPPAFVGIFLSKVKIPYKWKRKVFTNTRVTIRAD